MQVGDCLYILGNKNPNLWKKPQLEMKMWDHSNREGSGSHTGARAAEGTVLVRAWSIACQVFQGAAEASPETVPVGIWAMRSSG